MVTNDAIKYIDLINSINSILEFFFHLLFMEFNTDANFLNLNKFE